MKKLFPVLILLCLILSACSAPAQKNVISSATIAPTQTPNPPTFEESMRGKNAVPMSVFTEHYGPPSSSNWQAEWENISAEIFGKPFTSLKVPIYMGEYAQFAEYSFSGRYADGIAETITEILQWICDIDETYGFKGSVSLSGEHWFRPREINRYRKINSTDAIPVWRTIQSYRSALISYDTETFYINVSLELGEYSVTLLLRFKNER